MISASFYAAFPIISHYKKILMQENDELSRIIENGDFQFFLNTLNLKFSVFQENYFQKNCTLEEFEKKLVEVENKIFHDIYRFLFNDLIKFKEIFHLYEELNEAMNGIRQKKRIIKNPFAHIIDNSLTDTRKRSVIYYESRILQDFFNLMNKALTELDADDTSFELVQYWIDLYNIKMIYELKYDYNYKFEEIRPLLLNGSTKEVYLALENSEQDHISFTHPFLKKSKVIEENYYSAFHRSFRKFCKKKMGGIPFRHSYFLCFFLLIKIDFEVYRQIFAVMKFNLNNSDINQLLSVS